MISKFLTSITKLYQRTLSPDHGWLSRFYPGGYCRFKPTCSDYTILAINKYGATIGSAKSIYRILRCNPWNKGGLDLP
jgi:uncharacterized protein